MRFDSEEMRRYNYKKDTFSYMYTYYVYHISKLGKVMKCVKKILISIKNIKKYFPNNFLFLIAGNKFNILLLAR